MKTHLRHHLHYSNLFYVDAFASHIWPGDYSKVMFWTCILKIISNKLSKKEAKSNNVFKDLQKLILGN